MVGNSFTSIHHLPERLAAILKADVFTNTRGGATLAERLNPETKKGHEFFEVWNHNHFDYLILQDQSLRPYLYPDSFKDNVKSFNALCLKSNTKLVLYETWSYQKDLDYFSLAGFSYEDLYEGLKSSYESAAKECLALIAQVGEDFHNNYDQSFYGEDGKHPSVKGTERIIKIISDTIKTNN